MRSKWAFLDRIRSDSNSKHFFRFFALIVFVECQALFNFIRKCFSIVLYHLVEMFLAFTYCVAQSSCDRTSSISSLLYGEDALTIVCIRGIGGG